MPLITLPEDCLYNIFNCLNDVETFYNSLFVSRFVCKSVIPLLWSEPLSEAGKKKKYLIRTYLSCLRESEIACLIPLNIDVFELTRCFPLFRYERYIEYFSNSILQEGVREWLEMVSNASVKRHDKRTKQLTSMLWYMFLTRSQNITSMSYDVSILSPVNFDFPGLDISSIKFGIRHLQTIYLYNQGRVVYSDEINNFLKNLPLICTKIRDLHIYINESGSRLLSNLFSDIITAQQGLYEFEFMGCIDNAGSVISSLSCQGNSLKKLVFTNVEFGNTSLESFTHLKCLESLDINDCFFSEKHDHTLSLAFDKLVELSLVRSSLNSTTIASILKSSGSTLRKLKLDVVTAETLQSSIEHCCGLNHLVITSYMNFSLLFFRWIRKLDDLKILVFYDHSYKEIHTSAFVRSLAESLSATVYHLDLSHLILKPDELSYFLINCKARLKHFVLHCSQESFHTHLIIVTEYAIKRRCLRSLTITYKPNVCFPKVRELECVQTLGELGVQVTTAESTLSLNHHYW